MYQKYIDKLEFSKIIEILVSLCRTDVGKKNALSLHPSTDTSIVSKLLKETTEATSMIYKLNLPEFYNISDITNIINILEGNGTLNISSLLEVTKVLKLSNSLKRYYYNDENDIREFFYIK